MNKTIIFLVLMLCYGAIANGQSTRGTEWEPVDYVNTLMGSDSRFLLSHGNVYPAIARPWGMNFWTPQTGEMGSGWQYTYNADTFRGFKQTHMPSPWMNDYGQFSIMPVAAAADTSGNEMVFNEEDVSDDVEEG